MARRQGAKTGRNVADAALRDGHIFKIACSFIDSTKPVRLKSLIKKYKVNDACTLRDSSLGLTLLQIAIIADNIPAAEELSALGADVNVTLSQHRMELWVTVDTYYKLAQGRLRSFWEAKMDNLGLLRLTPEANQDSLFGLIHLAAMTGSISAVRFLVNKGHADVNAPTGDTGLTPLMCSALCRGFPNKESGGFEVMRTMVDVLLQLGGDLSRVNTAGNDFVAVAASLWDSNLWKNIMTDTVLLSKCTAKHAGRVALQLLAGWVMAPASVTSKAGNHLSQIWCGFLSNYTTAGLASVASAWGVDLSRAEASASLERLVSELSEPVTQRILRPAEVLRDRGIDFGMMYGYICFWPTGLHASTNALCAIMQATGVPPLTLEMDKDEARSMLKRLIDMGVQPEALLLPRRPDQGKCKMCWAISLEALISVLKERGNGDLSRHKEVLMDQLWCLIYTVSAEELSTSDVQLIRQLLGTLHSHGVDWTDPSAWPEDYVDGHWERQIPIPFLLEQHKPGRRNLKVVQAFCEELQALGNRDFVNAHRPQGIPPLLHVAMQGHAAAVQGMIFSGGNPERQGSDWAKFLMAATSRFTQDMAKAIHILMNHSSLFPVIRAGCLSALEEDPQSDSAATSMQTLVRRLAQKHSGFEALLLPLLEDSASAELLFEQCQLALKVPKDDIGALLGLLLVPKAGNPAEWTSRVQHEHIAGALLLQDPMSGLTLLGQAVASGCDEAVPPILDAIRKYAVSTADMWPSLLDCCIEESKSHKPLFAAVVHGHHSVLPNLLQHMSLNRLPLPAALLEHVVMEVAGQPGMPPAQTRKFVAEPHRGGETIDLLMCAASMGSASTTQLLIDRGMDPKKTQRYRRNRYYKSAMHAAVDCPDLAMLRCESSRTASDRAEANGCLLPGTKQMRCVEILLRAGAAMTEGQLAIILEALPILDDPKVARSTWRLVTKHVSVCARCNLLGCWAHCEGCKTTSYCSAKCQRAHWPEHSNTCTI